MFNRLREIIKAVLPYGFVCSYKKGKFHVTFGKRYFCPCCGKRFHNFKYLNYDDGYTNPGHDKKIICPVCGSFPRHRLACWYFNQNKSRLPSELNVLMFAAENSIQLWLENNNYHCTTADLLDKNANLLIDIQQTPFLNETWPLITCNHILEHVPDYKKALHELYRIVSRNGIVEISIPADKRLDHTLEDKTVITDADRKKHYGQEDHVRLFGKDFEAVLRETGFIVEVIEAEKLPQNMKAAGPSMIDDNRIYICTKM